MLGDFGRRSCVGVAVVDELGLLPDVNAGLLALLEEVRPALVGGVVGLQTEAARRVGPVDPQVPASHLHHGPLRLDHLKVVANVTHGKDGDRSA